MHIDLTGVKCPQSLIEAKIALKKRVDGQPISFTVDDKSALTDILRYIQGQHLDYDMQALSKSRTLVKIIIN